MKNDSFHARANNHKKRGKREFLNDFETNKMCKKVEEYFEGVVEIPRIKHGKKNNQLNLL